MSVPKTAYSVAAANLHWLTAIPAVGCVGTVLKAQQSPKEEKGKWMWRHKSLGLLTGMIVVPRVGYRLFNRSAYKVFPLEGSKIEHLAADAVHVGLYAFMTIMPATGILMGYYGGNGLPFFWTSIPGIVKTPENKKETGKIAGQSFKIHKQLGTYGKFLIPLHVGGAFSHVLKGQPIFSRILPWGRPRM